MLTEKALERLGLVRLCRSALRLVPFLPILLFLASVQALIWYISAQKTLSTSPTLAGLVLVYYFTHWSIAPGFFLDPTCLSHPFVKNISTSGLMHIILMNILLLLLYIYTYVNSILYSLCQITFSVVRFWVISISMGSSWLISFHQSIISHFMVIAHLSMFSPWWNHELFLIAYTIIRIL